MLLSVLCQDDMLIRPVEEPAEAHRTVTVLQAKLDALQMKVC